MKTVTQWMRERGMDASALQAAARLDRRVAEAILAGRYTPSPQQREKVAAALDVPLEEISWDHAAPVDPMYGHGPQFGRSP